MNDTLTIREARADEIVLVQELIREMAKYEKRPEDMTGTQEALSYWLFERNIVSRALADTFLMRSQREQRRKKVSRTAPVIFPSF